MKRNNSWLLNIYEKTPFIRSGGLIMTLLSILGTSLATLFLGALFQVETYKIFIPLLAINITIVFLVFYFIHQPIAIAKEEEAKKMETLVLQEKIDKLTGLIERVLLDKS